MEIVIGSKSNLKNAVDIAKKVLYKKEAVIVPTETVYGLAALASSKEAVMKIYKAKKRSLNKPLPLIAADVESFKDYALFSDEALKLADRFWPGPLTLIVPKGEKTSDMITSGMKNVAVRVPNHFFVLALLKDIHEPLVATSANISGEDEPVNFDDVPDSIKERSAVGIDSGPAVFEAPSTIIDTTKPQMPILRPGPVTGLEIKKALDEK